MTQKIAYLKSKNVCKPFGKNVFFLIHGHVDGEISILIRKAMGNNHPKMTGPVKIVISDQGHPYHPQKKILLTKFQSTFEL